MYIKMNDTTTTADDEPRGSTTTSASDQEHALTQSAITFVDMVPLELCDSRRTNSRLLQSYLILAIVANFTLLFLKGYSRI
jgi:hypothetical protein